MATKYNLHSKPDEVLLYDGKYYLIGKREKIEDIIRNFVEFKFN